MNLVSRLIGPFRKLWFSALILLVLAVITLGRLALESSKRRDAHALPADKPAEEQASNADAPLKPVTEAPPEDAVRTNRTITREFGSRIANFVLPPDPPKSDEPQGPPPMPEEVKARLVTAPVPISLFIPQPAKAPTPPPEPALFYLPSFRLIRCQLIAAAESGNIEAPLIGIVLEDQHNIGPDGVSRVVIPAGVEIHGVGRPAPIRDRIDGNGDWTFVWRTRDENNGMELRIPATALNRDYDLERRVYGDTEKGPGIVGRRFDNYDEALIKQALLASLAALPSSLRETTTILNPLTNQGVQQEQPGVRNAVLNSAGAGLQSISDTLGRIRQQIEQEGYYVALLPGKEFYLYTKQPIDLRRAARPGALSPQDTALASNDASRR